MRKLPNSPCRDPMALGSQGRRLIARLDERRNTNDANDVPLALLGERQHDDDDDGAAPAKAIAMDEPNARPSPGTSQTSRTLFNETVASRQSKLSTITASRLLTILSEAHACTVGQ